MRDLRIALVVAQRIGRQHLVDILAPAVIVDHQMSVALLDHVVKDVVGDFRMILRPGQEGLHIVALIVDAGEQILLLLAGVRVIREVLQRRRDDELVIFLFPAVDRDIDLAVPAGDPGDVAVQAGMVLQLVVQMLEDGLGAVLPGPQIHLDEVHAGLEVQILDDVRGRDLIKVAVAEGRERTDPDILDQRDPVHLAELAERHRQILQIRVLAFDVMAVRIRAVAFIAALGDAAVAVDVIALVLGLQQFAELLDLVLHLH